MKAMLTKVPAMILFMCNMVCSVGVTGCPQRRRWVGMQIVPVLLGLL